jgi:hypothetical protein
MGLSGGPCTRPANASVGSSVPLSRSVNQNRLTVVHEHAHDPRRRVDVWIS